MDWSQIGTLATACIISAGSVGGIVVAVIKFSSNFIADKLQRKYELKLSKELESYKTTLDNKSHISKTKFDKEFEIYQSICAETIEAVFESANIVILLRTNAPLQDFSRQKMAVSEKYNIANSSLIKYAPFIDSQIYDSYKDIFKLFRQFLNLCQCYDETCEVGCTEFSFNTQDGTQHFTLIEAKDKIIELRKQISSKSDSILIDLRNYLSSRDVLE